MLCGCGCGETTPLAKRTDSRSGTVRGKPLRFVPQHALRRAPIDYLPEDRGFGTPCWIWQRARDSKGYGTRYVPEIRQTRHAYRLLYEQVRGPVPEGMELDHVCRVRLCVNPDHLEVVTRAVNVRRGRSAKLTATEVATIRASSAGVRATARQFGVSPATITYIRQGRTWAA